MSPGDCAAIRAALDAGRREEAEVLAETSHVDVTYRSAAYIEVDPAVQKDVERRLEDVRDQLSAEFGALGRREGVGFLRYTQDGFYRPHRDRGRVPSFPGAALRRLSVILFLNTAGKDFEGGSLRLLEPQPVEIAAAAGKLVAFPSRWLHEVTPVQSGVRDVIVDWFYDQADPPSRFATPAGKPTSVSTPD